jgi:hypothetical protein
MRRGRKREALHYFFIEHIWFEYAYGSEDYRDDPKHLHSKKCGCIVQFSIKQLQVLTDVVGLTYYHMDHTQ